MGIVSPSSKYKSSYIEYIKELGDEVRYPFTLGFYYENFDALLVILDGFANGENLPEGKVSSTTLWLIKDQDIIGVTHLRHCLNSDI